MEPDVATVAALLADSSRSRILRVLMDGTTRPAGELARLAGIKPQTASLHLRKLVAGRLLAQENQGRFRYYRLASADVAAIVESFSRVAADAPLRTHREAMESRAIRLARVCYDHLAGKLALDLTDRLLHLGLLRKDETAWAVTPAGRRWMGDLGIGVDLPRDSRRKYAPLCLDWSERRHHIGGWLGCQIAQRLFDLRWIERTSASRAVNVSEVGRQQLKERLGL